MPVIAAPFRKAAYCLDHLELAVVDGWGEHLSQFAQELRHLTRGKFQGSVKVDAVEHRRRPTVLRTFDCLREPEARVADYR
jgi:hypothetical protein